MQGIYSYILERNHVSRPVVPEVCSTDPNGSKTSFWGIHGYISVMATFKFAIFYIKGITFC